MVKNLPVNLFLLLLAATIRSLKSSDRVFIPSRYMNSNLRLQSRVQARSFRSETASKQCASLCFCL
jgi:hypothetical protein